MRKRWILGLCVIIFSFPFLAILGGGETEYGASDIATETMNLSPEVLAYRPLVEKACQKEGIPNEVNIILAIMQVETGGKGQDVMQSSESAGLPVNTLTTEASINQGVKHYKACLEEAKSLGNDEWTAIGAYNFGRNYNLFVSKHGNKHTIGTAESYSRTVVAPSLGNPTGRTYSYVNPVSIANGKPYLYWNGGNFHYVDLVKQYLVMNNNGGTVTGTNDATGWKKQAIANALADVGTSFPTGWGQRGECIVAVQGWLNRAKEGTFLPGGVRTGYLQSGAVEVPWNQAKSGDVIQYENLVNVDLFASGVHTMLIESVNKDGTVNIVESNNPDGSGLVGQRRGITNQAPSGWRAVVWRFP